MVYILGGLCKQCLLDGSINLSVKFEYVNFPIGLLSCNIRKLCGVVGLCTSMFD